VHVRTDGGAVGVKAWQSNQNVKQSVVVKESAKQVRMYYGSGTGGHCCIFVGQTLRVQSPECLREMTLWPPSWKYDVINEKSEYYLTLSSDAYLIEETILPNFIPIRFETMEPWAFLKI